jgi:hypothetical protein
METLQHIKRECSDWTSKKVLVAKGSRIHFLPSGICFASMNAETESYSTLGAYDRSLTINAEDIRKVEMS